MPKHLRTAVLILAPLIFIAGITWWWIGRPKPVLPDRALFVNITTGEAVYIDRDSYVSIPVNDKQGRPVFFPGEKDDATGRVTLKPRYLQGLRGMIEQGAINAADLKVNPETGEIVAAG